MKSISQLPDQAATIKADPDQEHRKFPRFSVALFCTYLCDDGSHWQGTALNLSSGGCAVQSARPAGKGQYLKLLIFISPCEPAIAVSVAPVRWNTREQFGVEFITLSSTDSIRLQVYLAGLQKHMPIEHGPKADHGVQSPICAGRSDETREV